MATTDAGEKYTVGSLVRVRDREWVVLPSEDPEILNLRPLSGSEWDASGIHLGLEGQEVKAAEPAQRRWTISVARANIRPSSGSL